MKRTILIQLFILLVASIFAQSPEMFNYQAVVRDANGDIIANQNVSLQISILSGTNQETVEYRERHFVTTNQFGLVNLKIGSGEVIMGSVSGIDWSASEHFI